MTIWSMPATPAKATASVSPPSPPSPASADAEPTIAMSPLLTSSTFATPTGIDDTSSVSVPPGWNVYRRVAGQRGRDLRDARDIGDGPGRAAGRGGDGAGRNRQRALIVDQGVGL